MSAMMMPMLTLAYTPTLPPRTAPVQVRPALTSDRLAAASARRADVSMCGILAVHNSKLSADALRLQTLTLQRLVRHRGPDGSGIHVTSADGEASVSTFSSLAHERLAIVDPLSGNQPLFSHDRTRALAVNGEIYNHKALRAEMKDQTPFRTESDCEVIVHLYNEVGVDVASKLDGDFAFVLLDETTGELYAARDPIGVNSLYLGTGIDGSMWFSSEAKPLVAAGCIVSAASLFAPSPYPPPSHSPSFSPPPLTGRTSSACEACSCPSRGTLIPLPHHPPYPCASSLSVGRPPYRALFDPNPHPGRTSMSFLRDTTGRAPPASSPNTTSPRGATSRRPPRRSISIWSVRRSRAPSRSV